MSIHIDRTQRLFTLQTASSTYQMQIGPVGHLLHLYYGRRLEGCCDYLYLLRDCGFSPNPYELQEERGWSLDTMPQEYSGSNTGDFRLPALELETEEGLRGADLRYVRHEVREGKYALEGLPAAYDEGGAAETLSVTLRDQATGVEVELLYGVFEASDVITRAARIFNRGESTLWLTRVASACLDLPFGRWDWIHFPGRYAAERQTLRENLRGGIYTVSSTRGNSGHQHNPFVIVCEREAGEDSGACYGLMPVYSGNHRTEAELDHAGSLRLVSGINPQGFRWQLRPGERFDTPELILSFSGEGLTGLTQCSQRFLREHLCPPAWRNAPRPVLLNSWEASYFDVTEESVLRLAHGAKELGIDLLVLDDGWFGRRKNDKSSLGDWTVNTEKFPEGLGGLIRKVNELGLQFGIWIEPEMISEDSEHYRAHPDWALTVPGRRPTVSRSQLALDLSRQDVTDWIVETFSALLRDNPIAYVKWDINRSLTDVYSHALPPQRQGETAHRCQLGLYSVLERLTKAFPQVLFEGCCGGGGRFDAGMLAWFPQIWCSDNTDPIARLSIQEGSFYGYPLSAVGAHVSASPNHQTGRTTPLGTRGVAAMAGSFGYELDPAKLTEAEKEEICTQIVRYRELSTLVREGTYYRLRADGEDRGIAAWQLVSPDGAESLVSLVLETTEANPLPLHLRLMGLDPAACYEIARADFYGCLNPVPQLRGRRIPGAALLYAGLTLPPMLGDYPSMQLVLKRAE